MRVYLARVPADCSRVPGIHQSAQVPRRRLLANRAGFWQVGGGTPGGAIERREVADLGRLEGGARRHPAGHRPGQGAAEEPRLLLVQPGAQAPARARPRRPGGRAARRGRGDPHARRLPSPPRAGHRARRRHRQLRPGDAAQGRRGARPLAARPDHGDRASAGCAPRPARSSPGSIRPARSIPARSCASTRARSRWARSAASSPAARSGVGSITWGTCAIAATSWRVRVITLEAEPRVIELARRCDPAGQPRLRHQRRDHRGRRCRWRRPTPWVDLIVGFDDFDDRGALRRCARPPGRHRQEADHAARRADRRALLPAAAEPDPHGPAASCC